MTVSSQICKHRYQADGENRQWAISFPYLSAAEIKVYVTNEAGRETEVTAQCVFDEIEHEVIYPTLASAQDPLAAGNMVTIIRTTTPTQALHLTQQGTLDAACLEQGFDKLTLQVQELAEQIGRSIKYPISSAKTDVDAQTFLSDLQDTQAAALSGALADVAATKISLEQTVSNEVTARMQADTALENAINAKQNALSTSQQNAVNSGISTAKVSSYDDHLLCMSNPHQVTKTQLGLGNVDNTSDLAKPISSATQAALDQIDDELHGWQKPADWPDMRSGAMDNSIYLLIGHSADYSTYPQFDFSAKISNNGTYDVYIDGIKQFTTASEATTSINWQTLALTSGRTTTHPTNLVTHIVCITPTSYSNTFLEVKEVLGDYQNKGLLWAHFEIDYAIVNQISSSGGAQYRNPILEAITAKNDELKFNGSASTLFWNCEKLQYVPKLDLSQLQKVNYYSLRGAQNLKKIRVSAGAITVGDSLFQNAYSLTELPPLNFQTNDININNFLSGVTELKDTTLNFSRTPTKKLTFGGTSSKRIDGLKGLTVNSSAPFDNATAPQLDVKYTGLDRVALISLFNSMPTVSNSQVCNITGTTGAADLTAEDLAIATDKGWTITR